MLKNKVYELAQKFSESTHGSSDYDKDSVYVRGSNDKEYVPYTFVELVQRKREGFEQENAKRIFTSTQ